MLVELAAKWLHSQRCAVVITEMASSESETPDAIGWRSGSSILIECKASVSDFRADAKKSFRRYPEWGMGCERYFCALAGTLTPEMIPEKWGLLLWNGKRMTVARKPEAQRGEHGARAEIRLLLSAMRRIGAAAPAGISARCYTMETKNRATIGVSDDDQAE